tara:strand:+ start:242 stop:1150 length:909 start_codon:yes stop_codon:yes gene_type:complete
LLVEQGIPTTFFLNSIDRWIETMMADDRGGSEKISRLVNAKVIAKMDGVICGHLVIERLIQRYASDCAIQWSVAEGDSVKLGDTVLRLNGSSSKILKIERILLNILGKLSGISTSTSKWVTISENIGIACTRKTDWGLLDKWAVNIGGGLTHRLDRKDALMIKENDLASAKEQSEKETDTLKRIILDINLQENSEFIVIEIQNLDQAITAAKAWVELQKKTQRSYPVVLLLDNMEISQITDVVRELEMLNLRKSCILEGSGGVTINSIPKWASSGVDLISTSAVNRGVTPLDLSLIIEGDGE